jgi:hypothetical protein
MGLLWMLSFGGSEPARSMTQPGHMQQTMEFTYLLIVFVFKVVR